mmetsp:Transcript_20438/g.54166  ORF Transcript_20438/g.54166 Transcript_20438/m.54166 type:complete len:215 (-) Transcript_20438:1125-1769(-)
MHLTLEAGEPRVHGGAHGPHVADPGGQRVHLDAGEALLRREGPLGQGVHGDTPRALVVNPLEHALHELRREARFCENPRELLLKLLAHPDLPVLCVQLGIVVHNVRGLMALQDRALGPHRHVQGALQDLLRDEVRPELCDKQILQIRHPPHEAEELLAADLALAGAHQRDGRLAQHADGDLHHADAQHDDHQEEDGRVDRVFAHDLDGDLVYAV